MKTGRIILSWLLIFYVAGSVSRAQSPIPLDSTMMSQRSPYNLVVTAGGGLSYYSTHLGVPPALERSRISRFGMPATVRVMWYPDHRLRVGLESGWTTMYSYRGWVGNDRSHVYVSAVPVLLVFSMPLAWLSGTERSLTRRLSLTAGTGAYVINSRLDYNGTVIDRKLSTGWMLASAYTQPIGRRLRVAAELKWLDAVATEDAVFSAQLQLVWRAFTW